MPKAFAECTVNNRTQHLGRQFPIFALVAKAGYHARLVVVAGEQTRPPAVVHGLLLRLELLAQVAHIELDDVPLRIALVNAHMVEQE